jgi:hypothetical protein
MSLQEQKTTNSLEEAASRVNTLQAILQDIQLITTSHVPDASLQSPIEANEGALLPSTKFTLFPKLPPGLRQMLLRRAMQESLSLEGRIVKIYEQMVETEVDYTDGSTGIETYKLLRSKTSCPPLFHTYRESRALAQNFYGNAALLEHELCTNVIPFDWDYDITYLTRETLKTWSPDWREYNEERGEFPLNYEEGLVLREKLRRIAFDVGILAGDADEDSNLGNGHYWLHDILSMDGLGQGLVSFQALKEITLVISAEDARIYAERIRLTRSDEPVDFEEGPLSDGALHPDQGLSSITLRGPLPNSSAAAILQDAAIYLDDKLEYFFNSYERWRSLVYFKPRQWTSRQRREVLRIRLSIKR